MFSHDKLVWQLAEDAIAAARTAALQPVPLIAPPYVPLRISAPFHLPSHHDNVFNAMLLPCACSVNTNPLASTVTS